MNTKNLSNNNLPDVQSSVDPRNIAIEYVGVRGIELPVTVSSANGVQPTVAQIGMYVALPAEHKGTHMSRFLGLLESHDKPLCRDTLVELIEDMLKTLESDAGRIDFEFPFFVKKSAPVSHLESLMNYRVHQRSHVTISARLKGNLSLEQQIRYAEESASCELWSRLKRVDEKYVTESAYENPKFVEDLVRDVAVALNKDSNVEAYCVQAENFESIHNHSAYAQITKGSMD